MELDELGLSDSQVRSYQRSYRKAWDALDRVILLQQKKSARRPDSPRLGFWTRRRLRRARRSFSRCLNIVPNSWHCMWGLGKTYAVTGDHAQALDWFARASAVEKDEADVPAEAARCALAVGDAGAAIDHAEEACRRKPDDAAHLARFALAHLLAGNDGRAQELAAQAVERGAKLETCRKAQELVESVASGGERPTVIAF